jgi:hypothetical protein
MAVRRRQALRICGDWVHPIHDGSPEVAAQVLEPQSQLIANARERTPAKTGRRIVAADSHDVTRQEPVAKWDDNLT